MDQPDRLQSDSDIDWSRRQVILRGGALAAVLLSGAAGCDSFGGCGAEEREPTKTDATDDAADASATDASTVTAPAVDRPNIGQPTREFASWKEVRDDFNATPDLVHMAGLLIATHPKRVRESIERHRRGLNDNPKRYLTQNWGLPDERHDEEGEAKSRRAAARYLDMDHSHIALTENTTTGLATVYNGIEIRQDQEVVSGHWNHWATEGSIDYSAQKIGFGVRRPALFDSYDEIEKQQLVDRLIDEVTDSTRIVAVTWVHSISGLKLPIGQIGQRIEEFNEDRDPADRIIYCVDGVHGLGVEDAVMEDFHCDFFIAGCHKWMFGPRGTGIIAAAPDAWQYAVPTIPSFSGSDTPGRRFTPGGFHAFEHRWALAQAFEFHEAIGKRQVAQRIHALAAHLIEGLDKMDHVSLRTPTDPALSAGIVTFEVDGQGTWEVLGHLEQAGIIGSTTPEDDPIPRLSPGLLNDHDEIDKVLESVAELAG
jgi:selenocysteine lyase/cysteine desulfurase